MKKKKAFYAQSGGVTSVINASACGLIEAARKAEITVYAGKNGILGAIHEDLINTDAESSENIAALKYTPSGAFGSCRYKLGSLQENRQVYERLFQVFVAHDIGYFFYNGGGDSQDTAHKISQLSQELNYPLQCIGIPKTVDNDLMGTDTCPGFGSVAKYIAVSIMEAGLDIASMAATSTKVFILEVMGRHTGWIAAASGLAQSHGSGSPHIILFPEVNFDSEKFLTEVQRCVEVHGFCTIVASEGLRQMDGTFLSERGLTDAFGHAQLGGVAPILAKLIKEKSGFKYHWAVSDYLQRAARHIASKTDVEQAYALGKEAMKIALKGEKDVMMTIIRESSLPYRYHIGTIPLVNVANQERILPKEYISEDGFGITEACQQYLSPLIHGEDYPPYHPDGLPQYVILKNQTVPKQLPIFSL